MSECCDVSARETPTLARRVRGNLAWVVPGALLVSVPKCPVCLAAHVTLWTGLGLSLPTAILVRRGLLLLCVASLLFLVMGRLQRTRANFHHFKRGTEHCRTRS